MKTYDFFLTAIATFLLVVNQTALKLWLINRNIIVWPLNINFVKNLFSIEIVTSVLSLFIAAIIWLYLLKKIEFSILYPMVSLSYVFGIIVSIVFFKESIPVIRFAGTFIIIAGVYLIAKS